MWQLESTALKINMGGFPSYDTSEGALEDLGCRGENLKSDHYKLNNISKNHTD